MPHIWAGTGNAEIHLVRVLVVDHDVRVREILVQRLRGRGYDADGAQSAAEAFDLLSSAIYDIILLDVVMPRNAAIEVMTILRGLAFPPKCIVMSGVANLWRRANPDVPVAGVLAEAVRVRRASAIDCLTITCRRTPAATWRYRAFSS